MYGDFSANLESAENGIRITRKELKKVYNLLSEGRVLEVMDKLKNIDAVLLNSLSDFNDKNDGKSVDGKTKIKPDWTTLT